MKIKSIASVVSVLMLLSSLSGCALVKKVENDEDEPVTSVSESVSKDTTQLTDKDLQSESNNTANIESDESKSDEFTYLYGVKFIYVDYYQIKYAPKILFYTLSPQRIQKLLSIVQILKQKLKRFLKTAHGVMYQ